MSKEEITCKIPNNQIHISKEKDEDCLIWISPKAINMSNTIDELQQQNQKYKEVIEKIKTGYIDYYGTTKEVNDNYVLRNVLKEISDLLKEVE